MIKIIKLSLLFICCLIFACKTGEKKYPALTMSQDEIVQAMVEMYTINAAININDVSLRDSTSAVYYDQLSAITGKSVNTIREDFEKLLLMPDSMLVLQNRALDTLRAMQDKISTKSTINIGIN